MPSKKKVKGRRGGEGGGERKSSTKTIVVALVLLVLLLSVLFIVKPPPQRPEWSVSGDGILSYTSNRGAVMYSVKGYENNTSYTVENIEYASRDANITAILRIPKSDKKVPALILIPGAGVTAERMQGMAMMLSSMGYASLAIDKRVPSISSVMLQDYESFKTGAEPIEYKMVWDVLRAYDLLKSRSEIDGIAVLGESEGGCIAIISAALEPGIKGMIGISAFGDDSINVTANYTDSTQIRFIKSVDPDEYIGMISPRRVVMFHDVNDTIIDFAIAQRTFSKAEQPKEFYKANCDMPPYHGFCAPMKENLTAELVKIFA